MKNLRFITFVFLMCLIPSIVLSACTVKKNYLITAFSSDTQLGIVTGMDNSNSKIEGTNITLKANERDGEFVCWIKNNKEIIEGNENDSKSLTLIYGQQTAGSYTALFRDTNNNKNMLYAMLAGVSSSDSMSNLEITWVRRDIQNEQNNDNKISITTEIPANTDTSVLSNKVFHFGKLGQNISYQFNAKITTVNGNSTNIYYATFTTELSKNCDFKDALSNNSTVSQFKMMGTFEDGNKTLTLIFNKL